MTGQRDRTRNNPSPTRPLPPRDETSHSIPSFTPRAIPILSSRGISIPCLVLGSFLFFLQQIRRAALLLFRSVFSLQHIISKGYSLQRSKRCEDIKYLSLRLNSCCSLLYCLDGVERMALFVASSLFIGVASATSEARAPQRPVYYKKWRDDPKVRSYILVWCLAVSGRYCVPVCSNYLCRIQHSMYGLLLWPHTRSPPVWAMTENIRAFFYHHAWLVPGRYVLGPRLCTGGKC